jgi:hypothetical protein
MSFICKKIQRILMKSIDKVLNDKSRHLLERHLDRCPECRDFRTNLDQWQRFRSGWKAVSEKSAPPEGLNARIMAAVRLEAARQSLGEPAPGKERQRHFNLNYAATAAVALVLILTVTQLISQRAGQTVRSSYISQTISNEAAESTGPSGKAAFSQNLICAAGKSWTCDEDLKELLGKIPRASGASTTADVTTADSGVTDVSGDTLLLLDEASELRVYKCATKSPAPESVEDLPVLILAKYPSDKAEDYANKLKGSLATCKPPIQIEIIREDAMTSLSGSLDSDMLKDLHDSPADGFTWILILIGA